MQKLPFDAILDQIDVRLQLNSLNPKDGYGRLLTVQTFDRSYFHLIRIFKKISLQILGPNEARFAVGAFAPNSADRLRPENRVQTRPILTRGFAFSLQPTSLPDDGRLERSRSFAGQGPGLFHRRGEGLALRPLHLQNSGPGHGGGVRLGGRAVGLQM